MTGANPATVAVTADATAQAAFAVTCVATSGSIDITTVTTGSFLDPNNYSVSVDAGQSQTIGINATVTLTAVAAGARSVELSDMAGNCTVGGTNPTTATVAPGTTVQVTFDVTCVPPAPGTVAFLSTRGGNPQSEVFVMDGAGSVVMQVTQMAAEKWEPVARLSPDGTRILFAAGVHGQRDLWVVNTDGTGLFNLTNSAEDEDGFLARWSPDGTQVAYLHHFVGGIWVISASGGVPVLLTGLWTYSLDWSPDGSKIAFTAAPNGPQVSDGAVYVINSDGSGLQQLTNLTFLEFDVAWSPDGAKIVFAHSSGGPVNIFIMNADGTGLTQLTVGNSAARPRWSPDGSKIAFSSQGLWVMNPDGSGQQKVSDLHVHQWPEWSPDGSTIAFTSGPPANTDVYTIRPDGSGLSNITNDPAPDYLGSWGP